MYTHAVLDLVLRGIENENSQQFGTDWWRYKAHKETGVSERYCHFIKKGV